MACFRCGARSRDGARFCDQCGSKLAPEDDDSVPGAPRPGGAPSPPRQDTDLESEGLASLAADLGEQRHVTVMFCDLVDSTARAQELELEEWRNIIRDFQSVCYREVSRVGGFVAQYLGDGVLAYFGYPRAREQDAQAAVHAALKIIRARTQTRPEGHALLGVRIGLDSGIVLAGEMGFGASRQPLAIGSVPAVAARIQARARPDTVVLSEATYSLVRASFDCADIGLHPIRGQEAPLRLYEVLRPRDPQGRADAEASLTPLVGRARELGVLRERWAQARAGRGGIVFLSGEPGVGKTRLLRELRNELGGEPHRRMEFRGAPHNEGSSLFPVLEFIRRASGLDRARSIEEARVKLAEILGPRARLPETLPLLAAALDVPLPEADVSPRDTSQRRKQLTLNLLSDLIFDRAAEAPMLLVVEDVHWMDPSTLELLEIAARRVATSAVLFVLLSRPKYTVPWAAGDGVTRVELGRLDRDETEAMIRRLAGEDRLPSDLVRDLVDKSDGVPLYVEEVTRMVLDSSGSPEPMPEGAHRHARSLADLGIPATLQESLIARLDRLGPARDLVQLGAAIGRAFDLGVLRAVAGMDETILRGQLAQLGELDILHARGTAHAETFVFKHALIQSAAYASLVPSRRRQIHRQISEVLERQLAEGVGIRLELLAHHLEAAGRWDPAIVCLLGAGKRSFERSAYVEAAHHLQRGLDLLPKLDDAEARRGRELELCLALGPVLVSTRGYSNPDVEGIYGRARALCLQVGNDRLLYSVLSGLHLFHQSRAELAVCAELVDGRRAFARRLDDPTLEMHVLETVGTVAFWRGQHEVAVAALRDAQSRYNPDVGRAVRLMYGTDSRVVCEAYEAQSLWYLGYPEQARRRAVTAVESARAIGDVHSLTLALVFSANVSLNRGELESARRLAEEAVARSTEQHLAQWLGSALFVNGLVLVRMGRLPEGFASMSEGATVHRSVGASVGARYFAASMGEAYLQAGLAAQGLQALAAVSKGAGPAEDTFHDADLSRVYGELLLAATGDIAGATAAIESGLALARAQGALGLELRAATSLARLWRDAGRTAEARALLAPVWEAFTEGHDTSDARAATEVLASLARE